MSGTLAVARVDGGMTNSTEPARVRALLLAGLTAAIAMLVFATAAQAAPDPIASGNTDLHIKNGMQRKLSNNGITVSGLGATVVSGKKIGMIVREGQLDPTNAQGQIEQRGGFKLARGRRGVPVTAVEVNTVRGAVIARVAGARMQLGTFQPPTLTREGFGSRFKAAQLVLTQNAANRISNRLGLKGSKRIRGGRTLSNLFSLTQPRSVTLLAQGNATLTPSAASLEKLKAKGVEVPAGLTAIAPATVTTPLAFQLPISGGTMQLDSSAGEVATAGGVQILKTTKTLSPQLQLKAFEIDLTGRSASAELEINPNPPFGGNAGRSFALSLVIPDGAVVANPATRQIEVKGVEAKLQSAGASTLNNVLNQPAPSPPAASNFVLGETLGTFSLTAQAQ